MINRIQGRVNREKKRFKEANEGGDSDYMSIVHLFCDRHTAYMCSKICTCVYMHVLVKEKNKAEKLHADRKSWGMELVFCERFGDMLVSEGGWSRICCNIFCESGMSRWGLLTYQLGINLGQLGLFVWERREVDMDIFDGKSPEEV